MGRKAFEDSIHGVPVGGCFVDRGSITPSVYVISASVKDNVAAISSQGKVNGR